MTGGDGDRRNPHPDDGEHLADLPAVTALPDFSSVDGDTIQAVLEEAAKFAGGVLAPINWLGDRQGVKVANDAVVVPQEFSDAYAQFCEAGWPGIASNGMKPSQASVPSVTGTGRDPSPRRRTGTRPPVAWPMLPAVSAIT